MNCLNSLISEIADKRADVSRRGRAIVGIAIVLREHVHVVEDDAIDAETLGQDKCGVHDSSLVEEVRAVLKRENGNGDVFLEEINEWLFGERADQ